MDKVTDISKSKNLIRFTNFLRTEIGKSFSNYETLHAWTISEPYLFWTAFVKFLGWEPYYHLGPGLQMGSVSTHELLQHCLSQPHSQTAPVLIDVNDEKSFTGPELLAEVQKYRGQLRGSRSSMKSIYFCHPDSEPNLVAMYFACLTEGIGWCPFHPNTPSAIVDKWKAAFQKWKYTSVDVSSERIWSIQSSCRDPISLSTPVIFQSTSGSTDMPKMVGHGWGAILNHQKELLLHIDVAQDDKLMFLTHPNWMMWPWTLSAILTGATVVIADPSKPKVIREINHIIEDLKVTILGGTPTIFSIISQSKAARSTTIRRIVSTGSQLNNGLLNKLLEKYSVKANDVFSISGGTEVHGCFLIDTPDHYKRSGEFGAWGLGVSPQLDLDSRIPQQLIVKSNLPNLPVLMFNLDGEGRLNEYIDFKNCLIRHGDMVSVNQGSVAITDRNEFVCKSKDMRISLNLLYRELDFSIVKEAICIDLPVDGIDRLFLFHTGFLSNNNEDSLKQHLSNTLGPWYVPHKVVLVKTIPKTANGKKCESALKTAILDGVHKRQILFAEHELHEIVKIYEQLVD